MFKKFLISFLITLVTGMSLLAPAASAQSNPWYSPTYEEFYDKVYNTDVNPETEIFGERYTAAQVSWVLLSLQSIVIHSTGIGDLINCIMRSVGGTTDVNQCGEALDDLLAGSPLIKTQSAIANAEGYWNENRISGVGYLLRIGGRLNLVNEANAQGFGYRTGGNAMQDLWRSSRDVSYTFLIIIIVVMAFMIMFRVRISPQTVISVQVALPKVVMALILITFSYAIAGFMIDLMYVVIGLIIAMFSATGVGMLQSTYSWSDYFSILAIPNGATGLQFVISYWLAATVGLFNGVAQALDSGAGSVMTVFSLGGSGVITFFVMIIAVLVFFVMGLKIIWMLIRTFVNIMLLIFLGPLQILIGAVSSQGGFSSWLKSLIGELAVYPVVTVLYILAFIFMGGSIMAGLRPGVIGACPPNDPNLGCRIVYGEYREIFFPIPVDPGEYFSSLNTWAPPFTLGAQASGLMWCVVSVVIYMMIPKTAEIVKGFMSGKPFAYGTAVGEAVEGRHEAGKVVGKGIETGKKAWQTAELPGKWFGPKK